MHLTKHAKIRIRQRSGLTSKECRQLLRGGAGVHLGAANEREFFAFYDYRAEAVLVACIQGRHVVTVLPSDYVPPSGVRHPASKSVRQAVMTRYYTKVCGFAMRDLTAARLILKLYGAHHDDVVAEEEVMRVDVSASSYPDASRIIPALLPALADTYRRMLARDPTIHDRAYRARLSLVSVVQGIVLKYYPLRTTTLVRGLVREHRRVSVTITVTEGGSAESMTVERTVHDANDIITLGRDLLRSVVVRVARSRPSAAAAHIHYNLELREPTSGYVLETMGMYHERAMSVLFQQ